MFREAWRRSFVAPASGGGCQPLHRGLYQDRRPDPGVTGPSDTDTPSHPLDNALIADRLRCPVRPSRSVTGAESRRGSPKVACARGHFPPGLSSSSLLPPPPPARSSSTIAGPGPRGRGTTLRSRRAASRAQRPNSTSLPMRACAHASAASFCRASPRCNARNGISRCCP